VQSDSDVSGLALFDLYIACSIFHLIYHGCNGCGSIKKG
jgi:hypothetical protein